MALPPWPTRRTSLAPVPLLGLLSGAGFLLSGCEGAQSALDPAGFNAREILFTSWILFIGGAVIFLFVMALAVWAVLAKGDRFPGARAWVIGGGILFPVVTLTALLLHEFALARRLVTVAETPALTIEVTGYMWWWDVRYRRPGAGPEEPALRSANELVIPTGRPVELLVGAADVIHSFWVPSLAGKMDMIPGHVNRLALLAEKPGLYRGQCAEYCGAQHALMAFHVRVLEPEEFDAWLAARNRPVTRPEDPVLARGYDAFFTQGCQSCHAVRGTPAVSTLGPDLSDMGARAGLAAGSFENNVGTLAGWIASAQHLKPGNRMPSFNVMDGETLRALAAWLESLK
ncbi:cytochrome c oxidase subunit II [Azospirillum sp. SYSU D00513]|uniref:cytochrome c oxidase subunit II n=1 Tax=Azospirillum sp. SYSU D00513 TaxID=2812561 RepID=UPI001A969B2E|nr:cytochrome c oxidase subunit II [Azospirillum sp. SYSU D00513]